MHSELNQINVNPPIGGAFTFLGIQPENFTDAAFWKDKYNDQSLNSLVSSISSNTSVAIQKEGLDKLGLDIGDKYTYFYGPFVVQTTFSSNKWEVLVQHRKPSSAKDAIGDFLKAKFRGKEKSYCCGCRYSRFTSSEYRR